MISSCLCANELATRHVYFGDFHPKRAFKGKLVAARRGLVQCTIMPIGKRIGRVLWGTS